MQIVVFYAAVAFLFIYIIRCAFIYGRRTSNMPTGERLFDIQNQDKFEDSSLVGPPTLPFIGNLHQIPKAYTHIK